MNHQHEDGTHLHEQPVHCVTAAITTDAPSVPPDLRDLPHGLTIFLTGRQRAQVLRALRRIDGNRTIALLTALGLMEQA